jgi:hypothetical protein
LKAEIREQRFESGNLKAESWKQKSESGEQPEKRNRINDTKAGGECPK